MYPWVQQIYPILGLGSGAECTKIAHRHSLAIYHRRRGISMAMPVDSRCEKIEIVFEIAGAKQ